MAGDRRDVELIIRAKDQASRAFDSVTKALGQFSEEQKSTIKDASRTGDALAKLGAAFSGLEKSLGGASAASAISRNLDKAQASVARLEQSVVSTASEWTQYATKVKAASEEVARLGEKTAAAKTALDKANSAIRTAKTEQAALGAELAKQSTTRDRLIAQDAKLSAQIDKQVSVVAAAREKYAALSLQLQRTINPTETLRNKVDAASRAIDDQAAKTKKLQDAQSGVRQQIIKTADSASELATRLDKAASATAEQATAAAKAKSGYQGFAEATKAAGANLGALEKASRDARDNLDRQNAALERAQTEFVQFSAAAGKATSALTGLESAVKGGLDSALKAQRRTMLEAKREYAELTSEASKYAAGLTKIGPPTRAQADEMNRLVTTGQRLKGEYQAQRTGLAQMSAAMQNAGFSVEGLRAAQQRLVQIQGEVGQKITGVRAAADSSVAAYQRLTQATDRANEAARRNRSTPPLPVAPVNALISAFQRLAGEQRTTLSLTQRLRGEILSLTASYVGFFGAIQGLKGTINSFMTLDSVQNRLGIVLGGQGPKLEKELRFLRTEADRLGISFETLADQYARFTIAAKTSNFTQESTRKIFLSVAEAGRVNKLSTDQMRRAFAAFEQMISKGKISAEELREQLGDSGLAGVTSILAKSLNITAGELENMLKAGKILADETTLVNLAGQLQKVFGPGLAGSLEQLQAKFGRLATAIFNAQVVVADSGFAESFGELIESVTEGLSSDAAVAFFKNLGGVLAALTGIVTAVVENFSGFFVVLGGFAGLAVTATVAGMVFRFSGLASVLGVAKTGFIALNGALGGVGATAGAAAAGVTVFGGALRALLISTGIGLALVAAGSALAYFSTQADAGTVASSAYERTIGKIEAAHDKAAGSTKVFAEEIRKLSVTELEASLNASVRATDDLRNSAKTTIKSLVALGFSGDLALTKLNQSFKKGEISAETYIKELDKIGATANENGKEAIAALIEIARETLTAEERTKKLEAALALLKNPADGAAKAVLGLKDGISAADQAARRAAEDGFKKYENAIDSLKEKVPELKQAMEELAEAKQIDSAYLNAVQSAISMGQVQYAGQIAEQARFQSATGSQITSQARQAAPPEIGKLIDIYANQYGQNANILARIIQIESNFKPNAKNPNSSAGGLAQFIDSTAKQYGLQNRYDPSQALDAAARLMRDNANYLQKILGRQATGGELYLAHQQGAGGAGKLLSNPSAAASSIVGADAVRLNGGNLGMTAREFAELWIKKVDGAIAIRKGADSGEDNAKFDAGQADARKKVEDERAKADEERAKQKQDTAERLAAGEQDIRQQTLINEGKARQAEIEKAVAEAKKENPNVSEAELAKLREQVGLAYDLKNIKTEDKAQQQEAVVMSERVNALLAQRTALEANLKAAKESGDTTAVSTAEQEIVAINTQLDAAIVKATAMWQAIGGEAATNAITKLETANIKASTLAQTAQTNQFNWSQVGNLFGNGLTNAISNFTKAVGEGKDKGEAARDAFLQFASDFLIQVGQMIVKQALLNALQGLTGGGGGGGGFFSGLLASFGANHQGGVIGRAAPGARRTLSPAVFAGAKRYHLGGLPGLKSDEVPSILKKGEEVLTEADPRNILNGGRTGASTINNKIVNAIDAPSFLDAALSTIQGEKVILNYIRANSRAVKSAIGG